MLMDLGSVALDAFMSVSPTLGYLLQLNIIKKTKSLGSFSIDVCAILLFSNIFRIFFWFGKRFERTLLMQSIVMVVFQIMLLKECISVKAKSAKYFDKPFLKYFWRWDDFSTYGIDLALIGSFIVIIVQTVGFLWGVLTLTTFALNKNSFYVELIGYTSVIIEACLGLPQVISNYKSKSTTGLSFGLIGSWFFGDAAKIYYYLLKNQPMQFIMCGALQLALDVVIVAQIVYYSRKRTGTKLV